jgi:hypothetical protein
MTLQMHIISMASRTQACTHLPARSCQHAAASTQLKRQPAQHVAAEQVKHH